MCWPRKKAKPVFRFSLLFPFSNVVFASSSPRFSAPATGSKISKIPILHYAILIDVFNFFSLDVSEDFSRVFFRFVFWNIVFECAFLVFPRPKQCKTPRKYPFYTTQFGSTHLRWSADFPENVFCGVERGRIQNRTRTWQYAIIHVVDPPKNKLKCQNPLGWNGLWVACGSCGPVSVLTRVHVWWFCWRVRSGNRCAMWLHNICEIWLLNKTGSLIWQAHFAADPLAQVSLLLSLESWVCSGVWCVVCRVWCVVCRVWCILYDMSRESSFCMHRQCRVSCIVCRVSCIVCRVSCAVYRVSLYLWCVSIPMVCLYTYGVSLYLSCVSIPIPRPLPVMTFHSFFVSLHLFGVLVFVSFGQSPHLLVCVHIFWSVSTFCLGQLVHVNWCCVVQLDIAACHVL